MCALHFLLTALAVGFGLAFCCLTLCLSLTGLLLGKGFLSLRLSLTGFGSPLLGGLGFPFSGLLQRLARRSIGGGSTTGLFIQ